MCRMRERGLSCSQIRLVDEDQIAGSHQVFRFESDSSARIADENPKITFLGAVARPADTFLLDGVIRFALTRRISQNDDIPPQIKANLDDVPGGAGNGGNDSRFPPCQRVEQGRFSHIWWSNDRHPQPVAYNLAPVTIVENARHLSGDRRKPFRSRIRYAFRYVVFVGEVDTGFEKSQHIEQSALPIRNHLAPGAAHLDQRLHPLRFAVRIDEIGKPFGDRQIHLAVGEGAAGKIPWPGSLQAEPRQRQKEPFRDGRTPMDMEFHDIFTRETGWTGKEQRKSVIQRHAIRRIGKPDAMSETRPWRQLRRERRQGEPGSRPADTDDSYASPAAGACQRIDRLRIDRRIPLFLG